MFNLETAIKTWKRKLRSSPSFEDGDVAELESHLREEINELSKAGLSKEEAFQTASEKIGNPDSIGDDLYKSRATQKAGPRPPWKHKSWIPTMLPNYVKVSLRNFKRNFAFSIINILGLSVALAVSLLVITFIRDQAGYDTFHSKAEQIYRVIATVDGDNASPARYASSPFPVASILESEFPDVVQSTHIQPFTEAASFEDQRFLLSGFLADSSFFKLFEFNLESGNPDNVLDNPNSIILSSEASERFFGDKNPMGRVLNIQNGQLYEVTGVLAQERNRSHFEFEALISVSQNTEDMMNPGIQSWKNPTWYTYLLLDEQTNINEFEPKLREVVELHYPGEPESGYQLHLQKLTEINLGERLARQVGRITPIEFVYFLAALAIVIILASSINYVNLTVARSMKRVKEIGMRKVIGAARGQLISQFIIESVLIAVISLGIGFLIFWSWLLPFWNSLQLATADFGQIAFNTSRDLDLYLLFLGFSILVSLLAGLYPAIKLSSFSPSEAFKSRLTKVQSSGWSVRKTLVVLQISISLVLIISTFLLYRQSSELLNADYGFSKSDVVNVDLGETSYELLRQEMNNQSGVEGVSATSSIPGVNFSAKTWIGRVNHLDSLSAAIYSVDENFNEHFELNLVAGRNFSSKYALDTLEAVILNETAVHGLGISSPQEAVGASVEIKGRDANYQVVGVVEDFQFDFLWNPISPMIMLNNPSRYRVVNIHLAETNQASTLHNLESVWKQIEPIAPFTYEYYQNEIDEVYTDFRELVFLVGFLAILAILIACFGMLAMSHYDTQARIKEIGVRKVFGANVKDVVLLLSTDFAKIIALGILIGIPVAIYLNSLWLQVFANKTGFSVWLIIGATILMVTLTLVSIGWQTYAAALMNPVNSLRNE